MKISIIPKTVINKFKEFIQTEINDGINRIIPIIILIIAIMFIFFIFFTFPYLESKIG